MTVTTSGEGSKIRLLSANVANKIAAGEVVERPASVVKELLENAVDAGATRVDIVVTAGGRNLISVSDDGCGMPRDDAIMAAERQATSKISDVDDIEHISTLGFRGEALASIASVSRFTLRTRTRASDIGTEVTISGGKMQDVKECGCPEGTTIEVRDLFFNVPARRKFLRAYQTEQAHIRNTFVLQSIAHPNIAMSLKSDGDYAYRLAAAETLHDRLIDIVGHEEMERMVPLDWEHAGIHVHGFAGIPSWTRADNLGMRVYVNRRPSSAPFVQVAIKEAYPRLEDTRRPVVYLFIDLPPGDVDVNVHPTKREVRFRRIGDVRDAVIGALSAALNRSGAPMPAPHQPYPQPPEPVWPDAPPPQQFTEPRQGESGAFDSPSTFRMPTGSVPGAAPPVRPDPRFQLDVPGSKTFGGASAPVQPPAAQWREQDEGVVVNMPEGAPWTRFRIIGRIAAGYVIMETDGGYTVLDPAAAHERVLYGELLAISGETPDASQRLLIPQTVQLEPLDADRIEKAIPLLKEMGFGIEPFGRDTFKIDAMPGPISETPCEAVLLDTAAALEEAGAKRGKDRWKEEIIAKAASRAAVRTSKPLTREELTSMIVRLAGCSMPYTSPGGRPTMIYTSTRELDRRFGRG